MAYSLPLKLHSEEEWKIGAYNSAYCWPELSLDNKKTEVKKEAEGEESRK
jgi:hypothetical protein